MKSFEQKLLGRLYCFCGGGDDGGNSGSEDAAIAEQEAYDSIGYDSTPDFSMDSLDDDPVTGDFGLDVDGSPPDDDNDDDDRARREAEEAARQEAARQEAARQEAERLAAEIARIEAEEAARFEAEMEAEAARKEAERLAAEKAAEEERLSSPESLTDDQLDEAIATYSNANTAVASEVLSRLVEEKEIRTAEKKAEEKVDGGVDDFNEGATTPVYQGPTITGETTYIDEEGHQ
jgi:flagellar biosynthesis GTPase FlhF